VWTVPRPIEEVERTAFAGALVVPPLPAAELPTRGFPTAAADAPFFADSSPTSPVASLPPPPTPAPRGLVAWLPMNEAGMHCFAERRTGRVWQLAAESSVRWAPRGVPMRSLPHSAALPA
jgi:hypothetical protein